MRAWQPTPVFLPGEFHGQRSLVGYSPWGCWVEQDWATNQQLLCKQDLYCRDLFILWLCWVLGLPGSVVKNLLAMQETWVRSLVQGRSSGEGNATHSSTLAWRIPWTEAAGGLRSLGSQRVEHECSDWACTCWVFSTARGFLRLEQVGAILYCGAQACHCGGISYCTRCLGLSSWGSWTLRVWIH